MEREKAKTSAQWWANKTGKPHLAIRARNGQWMRESEEFVLSRPDLYPAERERFRYEPQPRKTTS